MAFYPAHCDNNCKGCEKNTCGWCIWKDRATPEYKTAAFKTNSKDYEPIYNLLHPRANKEST